MAASEKPDNPPTYDEAVQQGSSHQQQQRPQHSYGQLTPNHTAPAPPQHPNYSPAPPSRPQSLRPSTSHTGSSNTSVSDLYTANLNLPWRYPKNYLCKKCKNTGYKVKNNKMCKDCWKRFAPDRYYGVPAKPLGPKPNIIPLRPGTMIPVMGPMMGGGPPGMMPPPPPRVVMPGDPSIGGTLCPKCHGRGLVSFFLDEEVCRLCNGIGRTF